MINDGLTDDIRDGIAGLIAERLLRHVYGNLNRPTAWLRLAKKWGIRVLLFDTPNESPGRCMPALVDEMCAIGGTIYINTAYPKHVQAAAFVHEFAHLILHVWMPPYLTTPIYGYDGGMGEDGHDIARRVERIIFAAQLENVRKMRE